MHLDIRYMLAYYRAGVNLLILGPTSQRFAEVKC
jgi:hypothetical protein